MTEEEKVIFTDLKKCNQSDLCNSKASNHQLCKDKLSKYDQQFNTIKREKLLLKLADVEKDRINIKRQLIESNYLRRIAENKLKILERELANLKDIIKSKDLMLISINDQKKYLKKKLPQTIILSKNLDSSFRSTSVDRLDKLLKNESKHYTHFGCNDTFKEESNHDDNNKGIILQKILLLKCYQLAEKEVQLEEYKEKIKIIEDKLRILNTFEKSN